VLQLPVKLLNNPNVCYFFYEKLKTPVNLTQKSVMSIAKATDDKKKVENHFKVSGGRLICALDNGVKILARTGVLEFKSDKFTATVNVNSNNGKFYLAEHLILFNDGTKLFAFNCNKQKTTNIATGGYTDVYTHYVCDGEIYIQRYKRIMRISDKHQIMLSYDTNIIVKGNGRYTVIAYVKHVDNNNNSTCWSHTNNTYMSSFEKGYHHKLQYIRDTISA
jgi:hypothetical protein